MAAFGLWYRMDRVGPPGDCLMLPGGADCEGATGAAHLPNTEADKFRLRHFVERLIDSSEIEIIDQPVEVSAARVVQT